MLGLCSSCVLLTFIIKTDAIDPCTEYKWLPNSGYRGTKCKGKSGKYLCDKYYDPTWYRVENDLEIVNTRPDMDYCGTQHPIWMNGSFPMSSEIEDRMACVVDIGPDNRCSDEIPIKIKNCTDFYVYFLNRPPHCDSAYCFGYDRPCPAFEPCDFYYHDEYDEHLTPHSLCDLDSNWIKPKIQINAMECSLNSSDLPKLWLNDMDGPLDILDANICINTKNECCWMSAKTKIKNCSGFIVYNISEEYKNGCLCQNECQLDNSSLLLHVTFVYPLITFLAVLLLQHCY